MRRDCFSILAFTAMVSGHSLAWAQEPPSGPVCEPDFVESGIEPYGSILNVRPGQRIQLPDFTLKHVVTKREYHLRNADGTARQLTVPDSGASAGVLEFQFGDRHYVLETARTVIFNRLLASDELVVWLRDDYHAERARHAIP